MLYTIMNVKDKEYKLRLTAKSCVDLEKKIGSNPINVFMKIAESNQLPPLGDIMTIFHATLQPLQHNITINDTYDIFDEYADEGHGLMDLIPILLEVFQESGLIPKQDEESKNA